MKSIQVTRSWQTPVYNLSSWQGEIYGIINYSDNPNKYSLGTRLGLFTTLDKGQTWQREKTFEDNALFVWTLRRYGESILIGGMGGPNMKKFGAKSWETVKGVGHMPSDITIDHKNNLLWKSRHGLKAGNPESGFKHQHVNYPLTDFVPWFYVIDALHSGALIHTQWKWVNDFIAVIAVLLVITGVLRWWRKKWI